MRLTRSSRLAADNLLGMPQRTRLKGDGGNTEAGTTQDEATAGAIAGQSAAEATTTANTGAATIDPIVDQAAITEPDSGAGLETSESTVALDNIRHSTSLEHDRTGAEVTSETGRGGQIVQQAEVTQTTPDSQATATSPEADSDLEEPEMTVITSPNTTEGTVFDG